MAFTRQGQLVWFVGIVLFIMVTYYNMNPLVHSGHQASSLKPNAGERLSLREFTNLAERLYAKTIRQRNEMRKDWPDRTLMPFFPATNVETFSKTPYTIWDFVPAAYGCPYEVERIGRLGDGGKWVCGMSRYEAIPPEKPFVVYSFGIQTESSFEEEMLSRTHCEIWGYDYSVDKFGDQITAANRARAHFKKAGISGKTDLTKEIPFYSIRDLMKQNGHDYIDILKIDIEFAEFEALRALAEDYSEGSFPIGQILIEIHIFENGGITTSAFLDWWELLESRGIRPAWTEPNLVGVTLEMGDKQPRLAEYSLVNARDKRSVLYKSLYEGH